MSSVYKCNRVLIKIGNDKIGVVEGFGLEAVRLGGVEPNFKTNIGRHVGGSEVVTFTLRRWMYIDPNQKRLFYDLWKNKTKFMLYFGICKKNDNTSFLEEYLLVRNCIVYKWKPITGTANEIIGEEVNVKATGIPEIISWSVIEMEEGDFETWAIYDSFDETDTASIDADTSYAVFNRIDTVAILCMVNSLQKTYTISSKAVSVAHTLTSPRNLYTIARFATSAYGTYYAIVEVGMLVIFKDGVEVQTFTDAQLGIDTNNIGSVSISPTGKYIAISGERTDSGNNGWVILVGS